MKSPGALTAALANDKRLRLLAVLALAGLILVWLGTRRASSESPSVRDSDSDVLSAYGAELEQRLAATVRSMRGAGKTSVFLTFENTFETVYATNASIDEHGGGDASVRNTKKELAGMTSREYGETPVVVKQLCPKISGVLVVCEGGGDGTLASEIASAVSTACGVAKSRVYVTSGVS